VRTIVPPPQTVVILDGGDACPTLPLVAGGGEARAVVWPGVGAFKRSLHRISLGPRARTVPQRHPAEAVYYVIDGGADVVDGSDGSRQPLVAGSMVHIDADTPYTFAATTAGAELVGGPCPVDERLYRHLTDV